MKGLTAQSTAFAVHGTIYRYTETNGWQPYTEDDGKEISSVVTDSRQAGPGSLFAAIRGQRVDGHQFIARCAEAGAAVILAERFPDEAVSIPVIITDDTLKALRDLAEYYLSVLKIPTVGVVGSVGKTSTKEMTAAVLSRKYHVLKTDGNFNNELGVPLTAFRIREDDELAVFEMGINHFGEMRRLAKIVKPDTVIMTNIGYSHIEFLESQEGILRAKSEVFEYLKKDGCAVLNADDPYLASLKERQDLRKVFYGIGPGEGDLPRQVWADHVEPLGLAGTRCVIHTPDADFEAEIPVPGHHMLVNAVAAAAAGWVHGLTPDEIREGLLRTETLKGRFRTITTEKFTIFDDSYNASPASVEAALELLKVAEGRKAAVLGDMGELGGEAPRFHREVGAYAAAEGRTDILCCVGEHSRSMADAAKEQNPELPVYWFPNLESLLQKAGELFFPGDSILVKASRFMHFENIADSLQNMK